MTKATVPEGWKVVESKSRPGKVYFYNLHSRATRWTKPSKPALSVPSKLRARHLLVKHAQVRNPHSIPKGKDVEISKEEAMEKIRGFKKRIDNGEKLQDLASNESDCKSAKRGGDLGPFEPKKMHKQFSDAACALDENEISGIVESPSGLHIIERIALHQSSK